MLLESVIGHDEILRGLDRVVRNRTLAPAYIFTGPDGVGKRQAAIAFAKAILCKGKEPRSCDLCESCRSMEKAQHPDFFAPIPEPDKTTISVEQIRRIIDTLFKTGPLRSGNRVLLVNEVENLSEESKNTLLKTLEEPPPFVVVILVTAVPSDIPATIHSRCQTIRFHPLQDEEVAAILERDAGFASGDARAAAALSLGTVANALRFRGAAPRNLIDELNGLTRRILASDMTGVVGEFIPSKGRSHEQRERAKLLIDYFLLALRTAFRYKISPSQASPGAVERDFILRYAALEADALVGAMEQLMETRILIDRNVNYKTALPHAVGGLLSELR